MGRVNPLNRLKENYSSVRELGYGKGESVKIVLDMCYCRLRFHVAPEEYLMYNFMNLKDRYRRYFLINRYQHNLYRRVKNSDGRYAFKGNQYDTLKDFVGREYIWVDRVGFEELKEFAMSREKVLFKPNYGSCGRGIFVFESSAGEAALLEAYNSIAGKKYLCEEYVIQHSDLAKLHSGSVNTVRVLTLCDGKQNKILAATLRMGCEGHVCDNLSDDGIGAAVDVETGIVCTFGRDFAGRKYACHPVSGRQIIGFNLPHWQAAKEMINDAAMRMSSHFAVLGWDVAFTEDRPVFIEFNGSPGSRIIQIFDQKPKGEEIMKYIKKYGKRKKKRR